MSIPTSLIVVVLVLAWLMVLVPMVSRRREAVPEAEMAGGTFRVLRRSPESLRARPIFRRRKDSAEEDVPGAGDLDDVGSEQQSGELEEELLDDDGRDEYDDEYDADEFADGNGAGGGEYSVHSVRPRSTGSHPYDGTSSGRSAELVSGEESDRDAGFVPETAGRNTWSGVDRGSGSPAWQGRPDETDEVYLRAIPRRTGRGGYDPDAAEIARQYKYSRRRRVAVILVLATLVCTAAGLLVSPALWVGTVVFGLLLVAYLAYLRRQVQIEASIRERRLARLRRARQIRPEFDFDRADVHVSGSAARSSVPAQVSAGGRRRGREIVEFDDGDPSFDDLEYYQPLSYRRASGQ